MSFYGFWKKSNFFSKSTQDFTNIASLGAKTDWNSIFLDQDLHITDCLYIKVPYTHFYKFFFKIKLSLQIHRFYRKSSVWSLNWPKLHISWSWTLYYGSVIDNGPRIWFFMVFKKLKISLKIHRCYPMILPKITSLGRK
jgi:hypothetical protein